MCHLPKVVVQIKPLLKSRFVGFVAQTCTNIWPAQSSFLRSLIHSRAQASRRLSATNSPGLLRRSATYLKTTGKVIGFLFNRFLCLETITMPCEVLTNWPRRALPLDIVGLGEE